MTPFDLIVVRYLQWAFDDLYCGERREGYRSYCHPDIFNPVSVLSLPRTTEEGRFRKFPIRLESTRRSKGSAWQLRITITTAGWIF
jgi:hypothetical protein